MRCKALVEMGRELQAQAWKGLETACSGAAHTLASVLFSSGGVSLSMLWLQASENKLA